ncbi:MAG: hypothetical protein A2X56_11205 [Nitrospirae bacterium GWC2_57_13]|nr:MAG: hypothetical protein A2X56_11205 [Nitrospirae bacterium GWC2_57_13]
MRRVAESMEGGDISCRAACAKAGRPVSMAETRITWPRRVSMRNHLADGEYRTLLTSRHSRVPGARNKG